MSTQTTQTGTIKAIRLDRGFGFIAAPNQPDVFFHCTELVDLPFDEALQERRVQFHVVETDRGPKAVCVRPAE